MSVYASRTKSILIAVAAGVLLTAVCSTASAEWDPSAFVELLGEADTAFVEKRWDDALVAYQRLDVGLAGSLAADEIPEEQRADALLAHSTIKYQLALALLRSGQCADSQAKLRELLDAQNVEAVIRVKLDARLGEALLCVAVQQHSEGAVAKAIVTGDDAWARLATIDAHRMTTLGEDAEGVKADISAKVKDLGGELTGPKAKIDCKMVEVFEKLADLTVVDKDAAGTARVDVLSAECAEAAAVKPVESGPSIGPYLVMGGGAVLVAAFLFNEVLLMGTASDFDDARNDCDAGVASGCPQALDLADELDSGAVVSGVLLGVGAVALVAGGYWWWTENAEAPEQQPKVSAAVGPDGAMVLLNFRWDGP